MKERSINKNWLQFEICHALPNLEFKTVVIRNIHEFFHFKNNLGKQILICLNNQKIDAMKNIDRLSKVYISLKWTSLAGPLDI
jgi:hypothetical protein